MLGAPPKLQGVTVAYMEETGRLDLTLEVSAMCSHQLIYSAVVLNMPLPLK